LESTCVVRVTNDVEHARLELERREPDCLLCDYRLGGVTSVDFLSWAALAWPRTHRVLMSASSRKTVQPLLDQGLVDAILAKPVDPETALACIGEVNTLGRARGQRGPSRRQGSLVRHG